jgi:hypothetical protein
MEKTNNKKGGISRFPLTSRSLDYETAAMAEEQRPAGRYLQLSWEVICWRNFWIMISI